MAQIVVGSDAAEQMIDQAIAAKDTSGGHVSRTLSCGGAASAILDAARDAGLVVVGSRGDSGFASLLLRSVNNQVAHYAPCPVVVVPPSRRVL